MYWQNHEQSRELLDLLPPPSIFSARVSPLSLPHPPQILSTSLSALALGTPCDVVCLIRDALRVVPFRALRFVWARPLGPLEGSGWRIWGRVQAVLSGPSTSPTRLPIFFPPAQLGVQGGGSATVGLLGKEGGGREGDVPPGLRVGGFPRLCSGPGFDRQTEKLVFYVEDSSPGRHATSWPTTTTTTHSHHPWRRRPAPTAVVSQVSPISPRFYPDAYVAVRRPRPYLPTPLPSRIFPHGPGSWPSLMIVAHLFHRVPRPPNSLPPPLPSLGRPLFSPPPCRSALPDPAVLPLLRSLLRDVRVLALPCRLRSLAMPRTPSPWSSPSLLFSSLSLPPCPWVHAHGVP